MQMEQGYVPPTNPGPAVDPESAWTSRARQGLNAPQYAAYQDAMAYASNITTAQDSFVTWDYASAFMYYRRSPDGTPYPYVLIPQG